MGSTLLGGSRGVVGETLESRLPTVLHALGEMVRHGVNGWGTRTLHHLHFFLLSSQLGYPSHLVRQELILILQEGRKSAGRMHRVCLLDILVVGQSQSQSFSLHIGSLPLAVKLHNYTACILFYGRYALTQARQQSYFSVVKSALDAALCLRDFPSQLVEKDNKPYIELTGYQSKIDPLILKPIYLARNKKDQILIQPSINSCRISFTLKKSDEIERLIASRFSLMMAARANLYKIIRREPVKNYDVTLLITNDILEEYSKDFIIEMILDLLGSIEKNLSEVKMNINVQCRIAATYWMDKVGNPTK